MSGWFDARLSIGNVITIAVVALGIVAGWYKFDNRLTLSEDRYARQELRLSRIEAERDDLKDRVIRIEEQLKGQDTKLDIILRSVRREWPTDRN